MFQIDVTPALHLRLLQTQDAAALFSLTDRNREYLRQWLPWLDKTRFESDSDSFIRSTLKTAADELQFTCGLWHEGALCGVIGFNEIDRANHAGTLGYWLGQAHTGRGLMTKSVRAAYPARIHESKPQPYRHQSGHRQPPQPGNS